MYKALAFACVLKTFIHLGQLSWIKCYWKLPIPCMTTCHDRQLEVRDLKVSENVTE